MDKRTENERKKAVSWLMAQEREQRYLIISSVEWRNFENSYDWLQTPAARQVQKFYDFLVWFEDLRQRMQEFRWSKEFLLSHGIDFVKAKKLYFAVV